ncbi:hypothetical protein PsorP6_015282 [Peronosclerospora sorghi]|uniref:Uncharacterized protein n=1 Tax=Peronosclerospora sorghi TaxID=230839 RepID=A0ACC0VTQ7_9STRA|nr:hypothetical protein PsorP6_015282 [Peronosclerospora sorghi]
MLSNNLAVCCSSSYSNNLPPSVLSYVNVSGDSHTIVETVQVTSNANDGKLEVTYGSSPSTGGYLLTEIYLGTSNVVSEIEIESGAEVVIEHGVLCMSNTNKELQIEMKQASVMYVSSSAISVQDLNVKLEDEATLQLIADSITIRQSGTFEAQDESSLCLFTSSIKVNDLKLDAKHASTICINAKEVTASTYDVDERSKISLPNAMSKITSTGTFSCDKVNTLRSIYTLDASLYVVEAAGEARSSSSCDNSYLVDCLSYLLNMDAWPVAAPPSPTPPPRGHFMPDTASFPPLTPAALVHGQLSDKRLERRGQSVRIAPRRRPPGWSARVPSVASQPREAAAQGADGTARDDAHPFDLSTGMLHLKLGMRPSTSDFGAIGPRTSPCSRASRSVREDGNAPVEPPFEARSPRVLSPLMPCASLNPKDGLSRLPEQKSLGLPWTSRSETEPSSPARLSVSPCPTTRKASPSRPRRERTHLPCRDRAHDGRTSFRRRGGPNANAVHVSPDVTRSNETLKVHVSLRAHECRSDRVLLVGLFRLGQAMTDKPIFVKQVLLEHKAQRPDGSLQTRITFRAPRSPGEFEFRVFEDHSSDHVHPVGKPTSRVARPGNDPLQPMKGTVSTVLLARSNRLKVCLEYSHFIETLRATYEKFQHGVAEGEAGLVLSALLAFLRLVHQVETVFLHGHALVGDLVDACLRLLARPAPDIAQSFPATETIPHPIETFHGTLRNVLNAIETNEYVQELVANTQLAEIARLQRDCFCQVSGRYFEHSDARGAFWLEHFGFAPIAGSDTRLHTTPFVTHALTSWIERAAAELMPDRAAFRACRQSIYDQVQTHVIAKLSCPCALDVFGSSANAFGTAQSDMDMCLVLPEGEVLSMERKQQLLRDVVELLEARADLFTSVNTSRLSARIPIIMFVSRATGIECDLCVENPLAQRNTALLRAYASADPRVRVLASVLKHFVKQRRMNCAAEGTLSSYGYLLLLIHFLQRQDPPVLPVLQALPPTWPTEPRATLPSVWCRGPSDEGSSARGIDTYFFDPFACQDPRAPLAALRDFGARNTQSVGELLLGFWRYYGLVFDASRHVVSIRVPEAQPLTKEAKRQTAQWRLTTRLSIEDPFEASYDVAHVLKGSRDKYVRQQFVRAYVLLLDGAKHHARQADQAHDAVERIMARVNEPAHNVPFLSSSP